jgi:hypothetical protein
MNLTENIGRYEEFHLRVNKSRRMSWTRGGHGEHEKCIQNFIGDN